MLDSLQEICNNEYTNRFVEIAKNYGLSGTYAKYTSSNTGTQEIYFVCGLDADKVASDVLNIDKIIRENDKQHLMFNPHIAAFKITGSNPFAIHQTITEYCKDAEFVKNIFKDFNTPLSERVPLYIIRSLKMMHENATNPKITSLEQSSYIKASRELISGHYDFFDENGKNHKKLNFHKHGHYDPQKSKLSNWIRRVFSKDKNRVSLEHIMHCCDEAEKITIHISDYKKICQELRKRPEILYWMSKPTGLIYNVPDNQGFGSKENNDQRFITFVFDKVYSSDFMNIINKLEFPKAFAITPEQLLENHSHSQRLQIPIDNFASFIKECDIYNIKYCIDPNDSTQSAYYVKVITASDSEAKIEEILKKISIDTESQHYYVRATDRMCNIVNPQKEVLENTLIEQTENVLAQHGNNDNHNIQLIGNFGNVFSEER